MSKPKKKDLINQESLQEALATIEDAGDALKDADFREARARAEQFLNWVDGIEEDLEIDLKELQKK